MKMKEIGIENVAPARLGKRRGAFTTLGMVLALFLMLCSCIERIDISTKASLPQIVIYGSITSDTTSHTIRITRSAGYFSTEKPQGVSHAEVTISDNDDTLFTLAEDPEIPGLYRTADHVFGVEGKRYTLNVSVDFKGNGTVEHYRAAATMPQAGVFDSIKLNPSKALPDHIEILVFAHLLSGHDNYYNTLVSLNHKPINDSLSRYQILDDKYITGNVLVAFPCYYLDQKEEHQKLRVGDTVTMRIDAIPKEYGTFVLNAQSEIRGSIPFFGGPPANVVGNIEGMGETSKKSALGFFTAYSSVRQSTVVREEDVDSM